ncbi:MAG: hypothetical protein ASARMPRED_002145 [Alectoria sarmentosa]|nr:MAG: hypothetical protein ASARMPRED_002145 [Alectoria sarmentosa]
MLASLSLSLVLLVPKDATAFSSLIQPSLDNTQVNSTLISNETLSSSPKDPFRLTNLFVYPPVAVDFFGYGDPIPQATADVCLYKALDYALSTRAHKSLTPIDASDLDYTNTNVSLNFHPDGRVIWEEWKNALYLILGFVDRFDTREFLFTVELLGTKQWNHVGNGYLVTF